MKLRQIFESPRKIAVAAFGRMNPPTIGHDKLVNKIKEVDGDHYLFLSQTQKPKDNPLPFDVKLEFAKKFFTGVNVGHPTVRTPIQMLQMLEQLGYTDVVYVAGSDRVESFEKLFNDYNGKEYNFDSIKVISAGERDPDADGAEGMSASKMRAAAAGGDFEAFAQGVPTPALAQKLYDAVRKGMGVKDAVPSEGVLEGDLDEGAGNIIAAFAVAGGLLLGGNVAYQDRELAQQWMQSYQQIKDSDPDKADKVKKLVNQYKHTSFKNVGTRSMTKQQIEKIIADLNSQSVQEQGVAEGSDFGEPREILEDVLQTLEREVEWPLTEVMDPREVRQLLAPIIKAVNSKLISMAEATGDKPFDSMMKNIKKGTAKQATADRREARKQSQQRARDAFGSSPAAGLGIRKKPDMPEAAYEGNTGIMELFKFFSKAEKEDPKLVARVKEMIKQRRDKEVWRIIQDYTGTQLTGKEFEGSIKEAIFREAGHDKYWCSTDKKWKYRQGPTQSRNL